MTCTSFCSLILSSFNCLDLPIFIHDSVVIVVEVFVIGMLLFAHSHISQMTFALLLVFFYCTLVACVSFRASQHMILMELTWKIGQCTMVYNKFNTNG